MFFLAEYINMVTVSALATTLFLGGWLAPWPLSLWESANTGWWPLLWWLAKVQIFIFIFIWLRATLPRLRYDQFMKFGWKVLIPASIIWIMIVAAARVLRNDIDFSNRELLIIGAVVIAVLLVGSWLAQVVIDRRDTARKLALAEFENRTYDPIAGGFPVPPMPGQQAVLTSRRTASPVVQQEAIDG